MEYKVFDVRNCYDAGRLEEEIVKNTEDGWILVSVVPHPEEEKGFFLVCRK